MTKKDFQLIAATIAALPLRMHDDGAQGRMIAEQFANALATTNPRFKRELFIQAATGVVPVTARKAIAPFPHKCAHPDGYECAKCM